jgi:hypothetical protein
MWLKAAENFNKYTSPVQIMFEAVQFFPLRMHSIITRYCKTFFNKSCAREKLLHFSCINKTCQAARLINNAKNQSRKLKSQRRTSTKEETDVKATPPLPQGADVRNSLDMGLSKNACLHFFVKELMRKCSRYVVDGFQHISEHAQKLLLRFIHPA